MSVRTVKDCDIVGMFYQEASSDIVTGIKKEGYIPGRRVFAGSNGTYITGDGAHIVLVVEENGQRRSIEIERDIKRRSGKKRISKKLFESLERTKPAKIDLEEHARRHEGTYFRITEACCDAWIKRL